MNLMTMAAVVASLLRPPPDRPAEEPGSADATEPTEPA